MLESFCQMQVMVADSLTMTNCLQIALFLFMWMVFIGFSICHGNDRRLIESPRGTTWTISVVRTEMKSIQQRLQGAIHKHAPLSICTTEADPTDGVERARCQQCQWGVEKSPGHPMGPGCRYSLHIVEWS